jgi:hypothetical protein
MATAVVDLLPRDAELARRAAGGDGAAFVRLYDHYSTDVFATALAATGSVAAAADATQSAFLRILRWPPALGASDSDLIELLYALALGGRSEHPPPSPQETDHRVARLVGVGWLRSETVSEAGARFDADWSAHLWSPEASPADPAPWEEPVARPPRRRLRLPRLPRLPRLALRLPSPAAAATVLLVFLSATTGTLLLGSSAGSKDAPRASEAEMTRQRERAELPDRGKQQPDRWGGARLLRQETLEPLLAP